MRLIDADEFEVFAYDAQYANEAEMDAYNDGVRFVLMSIDESPTINAVSVVRCKDCKYNCSGYCVWHEFNPYEDDFCSKGEKK